MCVFSSQSTNNGGTTTGQARWNGAKICYLGLELCAMAFFFKNAFPPGGNVGNIFLLESWEDLFFFWVFGLEMTT